MSLFRLVAKIGMDTGSVGHNCGSVVCAYCYTPRDGIAANCRNCGASAITSTNRNRMDMEEARAAAVGSVFNPVPQPRPGIR